jgi:hypothetical protein
MMMLISAAFWISFIYVLVGGFCGMLSIDPTETGNRLFGAVLILSA